LVFFISSHTIIRQPRLARLPGKGQRGKV
jgi:hypothetical protein